MSQPEFSRPSHQDDTPIYYQLNAELAAREADVRYRYALTRDVADRAWNFFEKSAATDDHRLNEANFTILGRALEEVVVFEDNYPELFPSDGNQS